jgi:hypothetical protein
MEHPSATSDEPIKLPAWTPRCLVPTIRWLTSQPMGDDHAEILIRLLTDPRMQWVWDELSRLDPNTGDYLHPARPPPYAPPRSRHASQAAAMGETLHFAFCSARDGRHVTKAEEVDLARAGLLREAAALRKVASEAALGACDVASAEAIKVLLQAAVRKEEDTASLREEGDPATVTRHRGDPRARCVQIDVAIFLQERFANRLDGTAATLAAVALGMPELSRRASRSALAKPGGAL